MKLAILSSLILTAVPAFAQSSTMAAGPGAGAGAGNGNGTGAGLGDASLSGSMAPKASGTQAPSPGTNKSSQFGLVTMHSGNQKVHQKTVYVTEDGHLTIKPTGREFAGHLAIGPNIIFDATVDPSEQKVLIIDDDHDLVIQKEDDLSEATQDWSTNMNLQWNGQQYAMVCPNDDNKIIWGDSNFSCDGGIGVQLYVTSEAI